MSNTKQSDNLRKHPRAKMNMQVMVQVSDEGRLQAQTRDVSEGGIFVMLDQAEMPKVGDFVKVQVQGLTGGDPPWVEMQVVRVEGDGLGLVSLQANDSS